MQCNDDVMRSRSGTTCGKAALSACGRPPHVVSTCSGCSSRFLVRCVFLRGEYQHVLTTCEGLPRADRAAVPHVVPARLVALADLLWIDSQGVPWHDVIATLHIKCNAY